jgi:DNA (cytosine-5)-methyltransferase 1
MFTVSQIAAAHFVSQTRDIKWAICDLEQAIDGKLFNRPSTLSKDNRERIQYLLQNDLYDLPNNLRPPCHQIGDHSYKSMYGRLKFGEAAQTITSGFGSPGQGRYVHPTQPRTLTPHEAARLQYFPDFFDFSKATTRTALANMIGNAVPMKLSYVFCLEFIA